MASETQRLRSMDMARGLAILSVMCIHSRVTVDFVFHDLTINHAVPVFLVLMGLSTELWWKSRFDRGQSLGETLREYGISRVQRLMIPFWALLIPMSLLSSLFGRAPTDVTLWAMAVVGYVPWIGAAWFVTAVVWVSVLLPPMRAVQAKAGVIASMMAGAVMTGLSLYYVFDIMVWGEKHLPTNTDVLVLYYAWIFAPMFGWQLACGLALGRIGGRVGPRMFAAAAGAFAVGAWLALGEWADPRIFLALQAFNDLSLTVLLLGSMAFLERFDVIARPLAWLGRASWGIYLGHLLLHNYNESAMLLDQRSEPVRAAYTLALVATGVIVATAAAALRRAVARHIPILGS